MDFQETLEYLGTTDRNLLTTPHLEAASNITGLALSDSNRRGETSTVRIQQALAARAGRAKKAARRTPTRNTTGRRNTGGLPAEQTLHTNTAQRYRLAIIPTATIRGGRQQPGSAPGSTSHRQSGRRPGTTGLSGFKPCRNFMQKDDLGCNTPTLNHVGRPKTPSFRAFEPSGPPVGFEPTTPAVMPEASFWLPISTFGLFLHGEIATIQDTKEWLLCLQKYEFCMTWWELPTDCCRISGPSH